MKKLLALLLACMLILAMAGCTSNTVDDEGSSSSRKPSTSESSDKTSSTESAEKGKYVRGLSTATGWNSEWLGLKYTPSSDYVMSSEADLLALIEQAGEALENAGMDSDSIDFSQLNTVYEFMSVKTNGSNIIGLVEKLSLSNMTEAQYVQALKAQFESINYQVTFTELTEYKIGNTTLYKTESNLTMGATVKQMYLLKKIDDRMVSLILTETQDGDFEEMLGQLSEY